MKIPAKLKIGAIWWEIREVASRELDSDEVLCGDMSPEDQLIRINKNLSREMKELTLIHEVLHCIDLEMEHNAVEMLANTIHQIIVENFK